MKSRLGVAGIAALVAAMAGGGGAAGPLRGGSPSYHERAERHRCGECESCVRRITKAQQKRERRNHARASHDSAVTP